MKKFLSRVETFRIYSFLETFEIIPEYNKVAREIDKEIGVAVGRYQIIVLFQKCVVFQFPNSFVLKRFIC